MEEKREKRGHKLTIDNRKSGTISGIVDVLAFDMNEILLETEQGLLSVKGKELHISRLTLERGEVDLEGNIDSLIYSNGSGKNKKHGSSWKRFFQ
ncbi:MAG: sporulation protein YabP [Lachnospiraceae bacterium]|nr:sporulation protein YabP [Lachnospiraceae bacterium]MDD3795965.1 sporulation protein YabP [Lachnospiraceae bacterium]